MQATTTGNNRTGIATAKDHVEKMLEANSLWAPDVAADVSLSDKDRQIYIIEAEAVGSIPPPTSARGKVKSGVNKLLGERPDVLMDKIGERIAFERGGTRLYEALIRKYEVLEELGASGAVSVPPELSGDDVHATMLRIRDEEHAHFLMLCEAMESLGGDPTAQTPCGDVIATASLGLLQVVSDPRTTLAQSLNAVLTAELTDNAGWELLSELAHEAGEDNLAERFTAALEQEEQHLVTVRAWVKALTLSPAATPAA